MHQLEIAVVGSGISGLGAAWLLSRRHRVTLIEADARLGGHSNTAAVSEPDGRSVAIDTGFIVYNTLCYPNLIAFFRELGVPTAATNMSFSVSLDGGAYEYSGTGAKGLFGQTSNVFKPAHWRMIGDILRFFRDAEALIASGSDSDMPLGVWLRAHGYSDAFIRSHLLPMGAAIWSTPAEDMLAFPALSFARFFANHGLLQARNRPQWRTVDGGSRRYVERAVAGMGADVVQAAPVTRIARFPDSVEIAFADGRSRRFDHVVVATHADQALRMLADADVHERTLLGAFRYAPNTAVLHTDPAAMPVRRRLWSAWNFIGGQAGARHGERVCVSYWMNRLQPLPTQQDYFVTLNPVCDIAPDRIIQTFAYEHPMFDAAAIAAQDDLWSLQGRRRTWFCGSYFGYGFHEDGLQSGLAVAEELGGVRRPWSVENESGRIRLPPGSPGPEADAGTPTPMAAQ